MPNARYELPKLAYDFKALEPHMSAAQLQLHYEKHHAAYVNAANALLDSMDAARKDGTMLDAKATAKALSFNVAGHMLHSLFWGNLAPRPAAPKGALLKTIETEFSSVERFKKEFTAAANSAEGSGWAALSYCKQTGRLLIMQIEKHNTNVMPQQRLLLVIDVFEHAYYLDYKNERAKYTEAFWDIVDWDAVGKRFDEAKK